MNIRAKSRICITIFVAVSMLLLTSALSMPNPALCSSAKAATSCAPVKVVKKTLKGDLKYQGETVVSYDIEYPEFSSTSPSVEKSLKKINKYYSDEAKALLKYSRTELYDMAVEDYKESVKEKYPVHLYEAARDYKVTYNQNCILSVCTDTYEYLGGAHGSTTRTSETWNIKTGQEYKLSDFYPKKADYRSIVIKEIDKQISDQVSKDEDYYFDNPEKLVDETFNANSFYLTPKNLVVYFQQYDIAPYSSGIIEFPLSLNK